MADNAGPPEDTTVTFHVKSSGGQKYTLTLPLSTTTVDLKAKLSGSEYANVPSSGQRLIYSGKVLKDEDTLAKHNVKDGNTMHLVKSAASNQRQNPASQSSTTTDATTGSTTQAAGVPGVPQNLASGTGNDPLAGLTGARYAGFAQLPSASMFQNPPTPEQVIQQLSDPNFAQMMNEALQNPQVIDMMINQNPQLRAMGPQARQMLQSEGFRRMLTDPEALRSMARMQSMMGGGMGGFGGGAQEAFPAPGVTTTTDTPNNPNNPTDGQNQNQNQQQNPLAGMFGGGMGGLGGLGGMGGQQNPFAGLFGQGMPQPPVAGTNSQTPSSAAGANTSTEGQQGQQAQNPFAALFNPALFGGQQPATGDNPSSQPTNPFGNPEAMRSMMQALGGGAGAGANPFDMFGGGGGGGGFGGPADNRPPEERYSTQLRQLNEMGFHDFDRNITALSRSGGDVNGALEWLFSQTS